MRRIIGVFFVILLLFVSIQSTNAGQQVATSLSSYGTIYYDNLIQVPLSVGDNLAPIPTKWGYYDQFGKIINDGLNNPQVCFLDYNVVRTPEQPSIRFEGPRGSPAPNEVNFDFISCSPGDRVLFRCWINSESSPVGHGAIIGLDVYGSQRLWEVAPQTSGDDQDSFDSPKTWSYVWVPYGSDWTLIELDFIVPDKEFYVDDYGNLRSPSPQTIRGFIPWITASYRDAETANVWFADIEIYVISN